MPKHQLLRQVKAKSLSVKIPKTSHRRSATYFSGIERVNASSRVCWRSLARTAGCVTRIVQRIGPICRRGFANRAVVTCIRLSRAHHLYADGIQQVQVPTNWRGQESGTVPTARRPVPRNRDRVAARSARAAGDEKPQVGLLHRGTNRR